MLVLNTATLQFSRIKLPRRLKGQGHIFRAGETKDGKPCIVGVGGTAFTLLVWFWRADDKGVERWMMDKMIPLESQIVDVTRGSLEDHGALKVIAIIDGFVYLSTYETFNDANQPCWFLSFCLETGELENFFEKRYDSHVHPYIMAWPPSLVRDKENPQPEGP
uniref:F-box protein AT5G49610-like beta-propeller domain-containing protein n=1 Tax=Arundo donax TaxID=35708 RepID=A0A0A9AM80_ARUDO